MSMFGGGTKSAGDKPAASKGAPAASSLSIVGTGMTVRGDLETDGVVKVEGTVQGQVKAGHQVLVAKGGAVHGDIETAEAVIGGTVTGSIVAKERVEVQTGASVEGDVTTHRIAVAEGATLNGQIRMGNDGPTWHESPPVQKQPAVARPSTPPAGRIAVPPRASNAGSGQ